jgi:hypothetical protein
MIRENKPVVIEIPEDAYKQNTVYRPWPAEIKAGETAGLQGTPLPTIIAVRQLLSL